MPLWTPTKITTSLWLDGSDSSTLYDAVSGGSLVAANGAIARWEDKSGNTRHVTQSTAGARPARKTSVQNSLDAVLFDGGDYLENTSSSPIPTDAKTIVCIVKSSDAVGGTIINNTRSSPSSTRWVSRLLKIGSNFIAGDTTTVNVTTSTDFSTAMQSAFLATWTQTSSTRATNFWTNGTSRSASGTVAAESSTTGFRIGVLVSAVPAFIQYWNGHMMEIVCMNEEASTDTRQKIEGYLAHKWGTTSSLDAGHPYKSVAPTMPGGGSPINGQSLIRPADIRPAQLLIG